MATNEMLFEETLVLLGTDEEINKQIEYIKKKVGEKNISWIDENIFKPSDGSMFVTIRTTEETFKELKFQLGLQNVWV